MTWQITDLFVQFSLLNFVAFGGVTAMLPEIHRLVVEQRQWMDDATFAQLFAIAQAAPGPNLLFVSLIGWQVAGIAGGIAATLGICLPVSIFIFLLYRNFKGTQPGDDGDFNPPLFLMGLLRFDNRLLR